MTVLTGVIPHKFGDKVVTIDSAHPLARDLISVEEYASRTQPPPVVTSDAPPPVDPPDAPKTDAVPSEVRNPTPVRGRARQRP